MRRTTTRSFGRLLFSAATHRPSYSPSLSNSRSKFSFFSTPSPSSVYFFSLTQRLVGCVRGYADAAGSTYKKPHFNICTIGHVDHGKTTLTSAITILLSKDGGAKPIPYEDIDKAPEEKRRGITINASHVEYETKKRHYAHIDNPGHKEFVKNMITGVALTDAAILVVDATAGPMPQTREHILLTRQVGVKNILVWINKAELIPDIDLVKMVELEIREMLAQYQFEGENVQVIYGSALRAMQGTDEDELGVTALKKLLDAMDNTPEPERAPDAPFFMSIEDIHMVAGRGAVGTGVISTGKVAVGDNIEVVGFKTDPKPTKATVIGIETFHRSINEAKGGDSVGILMRGPEKKDLRRGMILSKPRVLTPYKRFKAHTYITTKEEGGRTKPFGAGFAPQVYLRTGTVTASIILPEGKVVSPGDDVPELEFELIWPCVISEGQKFSVREGGQTIAAGLITEILDKEKPKKK